MAKFAKSVNAFLAGEMSPKMYGRTDADQFAQGARELTNKMIRTQGGVWRRPGTVFISDGVYDSNYTRIEEFRAAQPVATDPTSLPVRQRMIPFKFSRTDSALVFLRNDQSAANSIRVYVPSLNQWVVPTLQLSTGYVLFSGWPSPPTSASPFLPASYAALEEIQFSQAGDVLVLVHETHPPLFLVRLGPTNYVLKDIYSLRDVFQAQRSPYTGTNANVAQQVSPSPAPTSAQPYYNLPYTLVSGQGTLSLSGTSGSITLTTSSFNLSPYLGHIIRTTKNGVTAFIQVTQINSATSAVGLLLKAAGATGVADSFELQTWNAVTGWPRTVCFHDQRLMYGGIKALPNTLWGSQVGDFTEMMVVRPADDANFANLSNDRPYSFALASTVVNTIQWMTSSKQTLFIGTLGDEWLGQGTGDNILGPLNANFSKETSYGSARVQALNYNGSVIFCDKSGQHLRELIYNRSVDAYRAVDLNYYAEHLLRKGQDVFPVYNPPEIKQATVQQGNQNAVYILDSNGIVHTLAKENDYGVLGWSTLQFGGVSDSLGSPPVVRSICVIPSVDGADEEIYLLVERLIRGYRTSYLERIGGEFVKATLNVASNAIKEHPVYADSAMLLTQLKSPTMFARFTSSTSADLAVGALAPTSSVGAPVITSNYLDLTGTSPRYLVFDPANARVGPNITISVDYKPNYSGGPAADAHIFAISDSVGSNNNLISLYHNATTKSLHLELRTSTGTVLYNAGVITDPVMPGQWLVTAGANYRIVLTINLGTIAQGFQAYINGRLGINWGTSVAGRTPATVTNFVVGTDYTRTKYLNGSVRNLVVSNEYVQVGEAYRHGFVVDRQFVGAGHVDGNGQLLGDGQYIGTFDSQAGVLPAQLGARGIFGYQYTSRLKTMDLEAGSILGAAQGEMARLHEATIRFERTVGALYGTTLGKLDEINFRDVTYVTGPIPLYTGDKTLKVQPGYRRERVLLIQQDLPMPCNVTALFARGLTADG